MTDMFIYGSAMTSTYFEKKNIIELLLLHQWFFGYINSKPTHLYNFVVYQTFDIVHLMIY